MPLSPVSLDFARPTEVSERQAIMAAIIPASTAWRLQIEQRGRRAGRDWVVELGITVASEHYEVLPMHMYLLAVVKEFAASLASAPERDVVALERSFHRYMDEARAVIMTPVESPANYPGQFTIGMLAANFCDTMAAMLAVALADNDDEEMRTLAIDTYSLAVLTPAGFTKIRARVTNPEAQFAASDTYSLAAAANADALAGDDGGLAPRVTWAILNLLNMQFAGDSVAAKRHFTAWVRELNLRFDAGLAREGVSRGEYNAYVRRHY